MLTKLSTVLILLGLTLSESFSPSLSGSTRSITRTRTSNLFMSDASSSSSSKDLTGKIVAQRYIYRFSPTQSAIKTPYTIEERQYYSVAEDGGCEPFGDPCFIFRGGESKDDDVQPPAESVKKNGMPRIYTRIGPALHTLSNLKEADGDGDGLGDTIWEGSYVMALYFMEYPEVISGKGLELGR